MKLEACGQELWDLCKPCIPSRSRLFNLEPIGIGSIFVESLMSYILRLADYHQVTPIKLVQDEIEPCMKRQGYQTLVVKRNKSITRIFSANSPLIRYNEAYGTTTTALIKALETLTGRQDLHQLSLFQHSPLISVRHLRKDSTWCPRCLHEWKQAERIIYTPQIWLIKDLEFCLQHREQCLTRNCPNCHLSFPPMTRRAKLGYCPKCFAWLGTPTKPPCMTETKEKRGGNCSLKDNDLVVSKNCELFWIDDRERLYKQAKEPFCPPSLKQRIEISSPTNSP